MGNVLWDGVGQHALHFSWNLWTEIDEQEIENLLNEHCDSKYARMIKNCKLF